jgi:hypothetical protein
MVGYSDLSEMSTEISEFELLPRLWSPPTTSHGRLVQLDLIGMCIWINALMVATLLLAISCTQFSIYQLNLAKRQR